MMEIDLIIFLTLTSNYTNLGIANNIYSMIIKISNKLDKVKYYQRLGFKSV
jgi:hypothetical protein